MINCIRNVHNISNLIQLSYTDFFLSVVVKKKHTMKLPENEKNRIEELIKNITDKSIGSDNPSGFCFSTSIALSIYLKINNFNASIQAGIYNNYDHFWLSLDNYPNIIIDPTIKQFDNNQSTIYIGEKDGNRITKDFQLKNYGLIEWQNIYGIWREPIIDKSYQVYRTEEFKEKVVINSFVSATIINSEIEQMTEKNDFLKTYFFKFYFATIYQGLRDKWSKNEKVIKILQNKLPDKFDKLLNKALKF